MKHYTLFEAIKEIENSVMKGKNLMGILYEDGSGHKFIVWADGKKYFVNLGDFTYKIIS